MRRSPKTQQSRPSRSRIIAPTLLNTLVSRTESIPDRAPPELRAAPDSQRAGRTLVFKA